MGPRQKSRFVEVIHTPDLSTVGIAPRAEVLDVQIAHREHFGSPLKWTAVSLPQLTPAIVCGSQEQKLIRLHLPMLEHKVWPEHLHLFCEPLLVEPRTLKNFQLQCSQDLCMGDRRLLPMKAVRLLRKPT